MQHPSDASEPRPLTARARDYAILGGGVGGFVGACMATRHHASAFGGAAVAGAASAALAASFIGLRHAIVQGQFEQDREAVSGLAAGSLGLFVRTVQAGPQAGGAAGFGCFIAGCTLHHAHRWWLQARLANGW